MEHSAAESSSSPPPPAQITWKDFLFLLSSIQSTVLSSCPPGLALTGTRSLRSSADSLRLLPAAPPPPPSPTRRGNGAEVFLATEGPCQGLRLAWKAPENDSAGKSPTCRLSCTRPPPLCSHTKTRKAALCPGPHGESGCLLHPIKDIPTAPHQQQQQRVTPSVGAS